MNNLTALSVEHQKLIDRLDQLDFVDPFSKYYYEEMKAIESEILRLNTRTVCKPVEKRNLSLNIHTSNDELDLIIESMKLLYANNAQNADQMEIKIFSNIHSYDFKAMNIKIRARVDFLDLYFEITKSSNRHDIKKFLTEKTGIRHYIKESLNGYVIRLHDMNSLKLLNERLRCLDHFGLLHQSMKIVELEVALDFYGYTHLGFATALLKSLRLPSTANNFRVFKTQTGVFIPIPVNPIVLHRKLKDGFNIGINHRLADEYWHIYQKQTDHNGQSLPETEWRVRAEKNVKVNVLSKMDNRLVSIKRVLLDCFKGIRFTQLKQGTIQKTKQVYDDKVEAYGTENEVYFDVNRNLRKLPCHIELNTDLNKLVMNAICNLAKNFNLQS